MKLSKAEEQEIIDQVLNDGVGTLTREESSQLGFANRQDALNEIFLKRGLISDSAYSSVIEFWNRTGVVVENENGTTQQCLT